MTVTIDDGLESAFLELEISGRSEEAWFRLRTRLLADIERALDVVIGAKRQTSLSAASSELTSALADHARYRHATRGEATSEMEARIDRLFAEREYNLSKARVLNAYDNALERENALVDVRMVLLFTKVLFVTDEGNEALVLGQKAGVLLSRLRDNASPERQDGGHSPETPDTRTHD